MAMLDQQTPVRTQTMTFFHSGGVPHWKRGSNARRAAGALPPEPDKIRFSPRIIQRDAIDTTLEQIASHYGHDVSQIESVTLTTILTSMDADHVQRELPIVVRRDRGGKTFTARVSYRDLSWAWGHGETIGEAYQDCLTELDQRSAFLIKHHDELGTILQQEAAGLERWATAVK